MAVYLFIFFFLRWTVTNGGPARLLDVFVCANPPLHFASIARVLLTRVVTTQ